MKVFQLLAALSTSDMKLLRKAVLSPLFNTNQTVVRLFEILRPRHPHFDESLKARQKLFAKLFPNEEYYDYKLRRLFTDLVDVIENLLIHLDLQKQQTERKKKLIDAYRSRNLYHLFEKETNNLLATMEETPFASANFHLQKLQLLETKYHHPLHDKYNLKEDILADLMASLDNYFILHKLRLTIAMKSIEKIRGKKYDYHFLEAVKSINKETLGQKEQLFNLHIQAIKLLEGDASLDFDLYEKILFSQIESLDKADQQLFFFNGLNHLVRLNNIGEDVTQRTFKWFRYGLTINVLTDQKTIKDTTFGNIIIQAAKAKAFDWAEAFIAEYQYYLKKENRLEKVSFYEGVLYYFQKDLDLAIERLNQYHPLPQYIFQVKTLTIRILFEKFRLDASYFDVLLAKLQTFQVFIKRDSYYIETTYLQNLNFVKITRKIARSIHNKESKHKIKNWFTLEISKNEPIHAKQWLIAQVNEI